MRKSTEARIHHRQTRREMIRYAVAGALTGIALTVGIATAKLTLTPKPPTPVVEVSTHDSCYSEGCSSLRTGGGDSCTYHRVFYKVDRALTDSVYYHAKHTPVSYTHLTLPTNREV